jgi:rubrerythrin
MKRFADLSEQEVLALAISNEEEDSRIYRDFAEGLRASFPDTAEMFEEMAAEEVHHRGMLYDLYRTRFGEHMPLVRRQDVRGFIRHKPVWLVRPLGLDEVRKYAAAMEYETARFYRKAAESARDASVRELLVRLSEAEDKHQDLAENLGERLLPKDVRAREDETARRMFVLQYVQPGLAGLMDGSVSTLAPLFAAAFATHNTWQTFLVGLAASVGAGISMGFAEALSDDGSLTGRGAPVLRGITCGDVPRRHRAHFALPDPGLRDRDRGLLRRGRDRARRDFLYPLPLHGHAVPHRRVSGRHRRRAGVPRRHPDREFMRVASQSNSSSAHNVTAISCRRRSWV